MIRDRPADEPRSGTRPNRSRPRTRIPRPAACASALLPMPPSPTTIASYITGALTIERRPALPLGEMLVEGAPFGVFMARIGRNELFAQHRPQHAGCFERARRIKQVLG